MEHARPPSELCLEGGPACRATAWRKWLQQFNVFLKASGVHKESNDVKANLLINLIGPAGYDIYTTFKFQKGEGHEDLELLIKKFNEHFGTKQNTTMIRFKFFTRNQEQGESIDEYVTSLKLLSQHCEFEHLEEGLIRDRIVCGVTDGNLRDRLLRADELTLQIAIKICQANEMSREEKKQIEGTKEDTDKMYGTSSKAVDVVYRSRGEVRAGASGWTRRARSGAAPGPGGPRDYRAGGAGAAAAAGMRRYENRSATSCLSCGAARPCREPLLPHAIPELPWSKVGSDIFYYRNKYYMILVDYFSNFIEVNPLHSIGSKSVIVAMKDQFARHGIPTELITDNGPAYSSKEFKEFCKQWNFKHTTTSPYYPQANGRSERSVQTIKNILIKAIDSESDFYLGLLNFRATPRDDISSPAELLMGRRLNTRLPIHDKKLKPQRDNNKDYQAILRKQNISKTYYDQRSRALPELKPGENVILADDTDGKRKRAQVESRAPQPRSYFVTDMSGKRYRRNRRHLIKLNTAIKDEVEDNGRDSESDGLGGRSDQSRAPSPLGTGMTTYYIIPTISSDSDDSCKKPRRLAKAKAYNELDKLINQKLNFQ